MFAKLPRFRFRLITLFGSISAIAFILDLYKDWALVPVRRGTIYSAICYASDWEKLAKALPASKQVDFAIHTFDVADAGDLFDGFAVRPLKLPVAKIPEQIGQAVQHKPSILTGTVIF